MLGYEFVNLTPSQVEARRKLLDQAGYQAYLAPILILSAVYLFHEVFPSPTSSKQSTHPSTITLLTRRLSWILNTTYFPEFGPLHIQLLALLYTSFLLWRITYQTTNDYMHVTKAFGHVAVSQLPMHYLLAIKWPYSPVTLATGLTHERLNTYHRLFGRIIHTLLACHAVLYLNFFVKIGVLAKRIKDSDVRLGVLAFWTINLLGVLAIQPVRRLMYHRVFYRSHVLLSALLPLVLWFHVPYTRVYVGQAAVVWVVNGVLRLGASQTAKVNCESVAKDLVRIKARVGGKHLYPYVPGCHVYLNQHGFGPRTPFTVVAAQGLPGGETEVELVAKDSGGPMTGKLGELAKSDEEEALDLEGPYGEAQIYMPILLQEAGQDLSKVLIVAGGVGATYALPIYKALCDTAEKDGKSSKNIRMLWVVRREEDVAWAASFLSRGKDRPGIFISVTQSAASGTLQQEKKQADTLGKSGRPNLDQFVDDVFNEKLAEESDGLIRAGTKTKQKLHDRVIVMVCGPPGLSKSLREAVGKHVLGYGRRVRWFEEQFGFGGNA